MALPTMMKLLRLLFWLAAFAAATFFVVLFEHGFDEVFGRLRGGV
ncbi:MAG: hypothetical protein R3F11_18205 [Verrucomicrobiales bacterium]